MNRFDPQLRRLARSRLSFWRGLLNDVIDHAFATPTDVHLTKWLRAYSHEEVGWAHGEIQCVYISLGLPNSRRSLMFVKPVYRFHLSDSLATPERIEIAVRTAAVHETWLTLHGKDIGWSKDFAAAILRYRRETKAQQREVDALLATFKEER